MSKKYKTDNNSYIFPLKSNLAHYPFNCCKIEPINDPNVKTIAEAFNQFKTDIWVKDIIQGPTFTQYRFDFKHGTLKSQLLKQPEYFAQNLCVSSVRIVPPSSENPYIIIEVPNANRFTVGFDSMVDSVQASKANIPMGLGVDINGTPNVVDLTQMQHLLLLGDSGSGKTIFIHSLINSVLFSRTPHQVKLLMADLNGFELPTYNGIPHLLSPVMSNQEDVLKALEDLCAEMERRMGLFYESRTKSIVAYNEYAEKNNKERLPYIAFIIDEFEPLMVKFREQFEHWIKRITAVARFCGIHLILATKHIDKEVITRVIRFNIPSVITFKVKDTSDVKAGIIDKDAASLLGRGDLLFTEPGSDTGRRLQGAFIGS